MSKSSLGIDTPENLSRVVLETLNFRGFGVSETTLNTTEIKYYWWR